MDSSGHVDAKSLLRDRHSKVDESVARLRALAKHRSQKAIVTPGTLEGAVIADHAVVEN